MPLICNLHMSAMYSIAVNCDTLQILHEKPVSFILVVDNYKCSFCKGKSLNQMTNHVMENNETNILSIQYLTIVFMATQDDENRLKRNILMLLLCIEAVAMTQLQILHLMNMHIQIVNIVGSFQNKVFRALPICCIVIITWACNLIAHCGDSIAEINKLPICCIVIITWACNLIAHPARLSNSRYRSYPVAGQAPSPLEYLAFNLDATTWGLGGMIEECFLIVNALFLFVATDAILSKRCLAHLPVFPPENFLSPKNHHKLDLAFIFKKLCLFHMTRSKTHYMLSTDNQHIISFFRLQISIALGPRFLIDCQDTILSFN
ncbi:hypothetical protein ACJX0J_018292, partial [Zea mays]